MSKLGFIQEYPIHFNLISNSLIFQGLKSLMFEKCAALGKKWREKDAMSSRINRTNEHGLSLIVELEG